MKLGKSLRLAANGFDFAYEAILGAMFTVLVLVATPLWLSEVGVAVIRRKFRGFAYRGIFKAENYLDWLFAQRTEANYTVFMVRLFGLEMRYL